MTPGGAEGLMAEGPVVTCKRFVLDLLYDYLDAALGPEVVAEVEGHLAECDPCRAYLATYRRTREIAADAVAEPMPDEMKTRLRAFLLEQLSRKRL